MINPKASLWLASGSEARRQLLIGSGLSISVKVASVDEAAIKSAQCAMRSTPDQVALLLAQEKAMAVDCMLTAASGKLAQGPAPLVIGADQLLVCDGEWFDKPRDMAEAAAQLKRLRGRWHVLHSAVVVVQEMEVLWRHVSHPCLRMRSFSDDWLASYLAAEGAAVLSSVGAYRLEGLGAQLFDQIEGDHSAILGLPLLPLTAFLRDIGALAV